MRSQYSALPWPVLGENLTQLRQSLNVTPRMPRFFSQNVTWGHRKRFADGKLLIPYKSFLGYEKGPDGLPQIIEEEAEAVRWIYALFLAGKTYRQIAKLLMDQGIPTPRGNTKWSVSTVQSILQNEKYAGNAILQKRYTIDFLSKTTKVNEGELPP